MAKFVTKDRDFTKKFDHLMPKKYERMGYGPRSMDQKDYFNSIKPTKAYEGYGYTESMDWTKNPMATKENSTVISMDDRYCPDGSLIVAGQCLETNMETPTRYCQEGYKYHNGECMPEDKQKFMMHSNYGNQEGSRATFAEKQDPSDPEVNQPPVCPPGWSYQNGVCKVSKEFKKAN